MLFWKQKTINIAPLQKNKYLAILYIAWNCIKLSLLFIDGFCLMFAPLVCAALIVKDSKSVFAYILGILSIIGFYYNFSKNIFGFLDGPMENAELDLKENLASLHYHARAIRVFKKYNKLETIGNAHDANFIEFFMARYYGVELDLNVSDPHYIKGFPYMHEFGKKY
ncbi:MAG TPA: hypothetical protein IAA60_09620 [Candidatus Ornithomonoglobus intestinigallinarum]|uniref:Uncharacterized protein n=1 Tax=Candidatus Ornithomonoglobus intestinigallinarum TaxID=2840894 RepID=A0A9D1H4R7_9FIRM|nr:hypothetical protein [Candidatus Ornithomonoglobus intestinigallinarum]